MIHEAGWQPCALLVVEHFPLVDAGESELVRGSRSGQGPHKVKPSYLRVLALLLVLFLPMPHPTPLSVPSIRLYVDHFFAAYETFRAIEVP